MPSRVSCPTVLMQQAQWFTLATHGSAALHLDALLGRLVDETQALGLGPISPAKLTRILDGQHRLAGPLTADYPISMTLTNLLSAPLRVRPKTIDAWALGVRLDGLRHTAFRVFTQRLQHLA
ncbi:MAG: hypothetical protein AAF827_22605 [Cyanobacteria bacterium P01_D01_bin.6]